MDLVQLKQVFSCSLCGEVYNEPVTLLCNHTFCHHCLANVSTRNCPKCNVRVWIPPQTIVNNVVKDAILHLYGQMEDGDKDVDAAEFANNPLDDIQSEWFDSVVEAAVANKDNDDKTSGCCPLYNSAGGCTKGDQCVNKHEYDVQLLHSELERVKHHCKAAIPSIGATVCLDFSTLGGCKKGGACENEHILHVPTMTKEIIRVRKKYGFLFPETDVCKPYSTIAGCTKGDSCDQVHVPHVPTMIKTIHKARKIKRFPSLETCLAALVGGLVMLIMTKLVAAC